MKDKILRYLADGLKPGQVASLVGCSPGYISQLLKEDDFRDRLQARIADNPVPVADALESRYQGLESDLINAMRDSIPNSELPAITRALEVVAKIQDQKHTRKNPAAASTVTNVHVVQLTLPAHAIPSQPVIQLNSTGEILAINNQALAPLSSDGVKDLFSRIKEHKAQQERISHDL